MKKILPLTISVAAIAATLMGTVPAAEYHVALSGQNSSRGTQADPWRTIQHAAHHAQPGDTIVVHQGIYRERINPPRGGDSDARRVVYHAAAGEDVEIRGSEVVTNWMKIKDDTWKAVLPNTFFGNFNPYGDRIWGDWFDGKGREHHTGAVYLNGEWLTEAAKLEEVLRPVSGPSLWFARVETDHTSIWAQFQGVDPNAQLVEINVRRTVFYPDQPGRNYITVRGFKLRHAATPWAPPTAEQMGLIGTHWSKGWIIEGNVVSHSICSGIALGKHGDQWDNTSANTAEGYVATIERALKNGWNKEIIGHHVVRNNTISHCEQTAIVGSLGAAFSEVTGNRIHDIHVRRLFTGAEMAGIKFHAAIDTVIRSNHIYRTCLGLWLDWMAQGTRVSANLFHDNETDLFVEVNHGPFVVDNNLFLSGHNLLDMSEGGAFVHNLFAGRISSHPEPNRSTPYHPPHTTRVAGLTTTRGGDDRFYNNVFIGAGSWKADGGTQNPSPFGLAMYNARELPLFTGGNVFYHGAQPYGKETNCVASLATDPGVKLNLEAGRATLTMHAGSELARAETALVTTASLGRTAVAKVAYEQADGAPFQIDHDYFGQPRSQSSPTPGPFELPLDGTKVLREWK